MSLVSLFAGIGGFERGFAASGVRVSMLCEIDPPARTVLSSNLGVPDEEIVADVRDVESLPSGANILCAGFPCQDLSSVGTKEGVGGQKSSLITEVLRILRNHPVEWVVLENVPFMLHLQGGRAIREITDALSEIGYRWAYRVIDSSSFGVPQRRRRVYVVASLNHDPRGVLLAADLPDRATVELTIDTPLGFYWTEGTYSTGLAMDQVPPLKAGSTVGIPSPPAILFPDGFAGTPNIRDAERLQGFPADWTFPAETVARRSVRWRLVGNAVTVQAAAWLAERISEPATYDPSKDVQFDGSSTWPNAAWSVDGTVFVSAVSEFPVRRTRPGLQEFLRFPVKPLSERATQGFLKRARKGNLRFPEGFLEQLEAHIATGSVAGSSAKAR